MLIEKIYAQARRTPDKAAIVYNNMPVSYRAFACAIDAARRYLAAQELPGDGVAVLAIDALADAWILGLALRNLGLTTVAAASVDSIAGLGLPEIRCVIATDTEHRPGLDARCAAAHWRLVTVPTAIYADCAVGAAPEMPDLPAPEGGHILLTSGTTGVYKKFLIDPASEAVQIRHRENFLQLSDQSVVNVFKFGLWTVAGYNLPASTWHAGATAVIYQGQNPWESFRHPGVTHAIVVPKLLSEILGAPPGALTRDDTLRLFVGGGPLSPAMAEAARTRLTARLYTHIACTEASSYALTPIERPEDLKWHRIFPTREVQVVDEEGGVLPAGRVGLVRIRLLDGAGGYLHDAVATREFFRDGYFYPGDLGVIRSDGRLALHGRVTDVINVLGSKFAAGPIEEALRHKFGVSDACVFSMPRADGEEVVHVVIEASRCIEFAEVFAALGSLLPSRGTIRAQAHFVQILPRNDMGKVQRDVLKERLGLSVG